MERHDCSRTGIRQIDVRLHKDRRQVDRDVRLCKDRHQVDGEVSDCADRHQVDRDVRLCKDKRQVDGSDFFWVVVEVVGGVIFLRWCCVGMCSM